MTLAEQSRAAHMIASAAAKDSGAEWNRRYVASIELQGFALHPINESTPLGPDGPLWAPRPAEEGWQYPYPCVIAPKDWQRPR